MFWIFGLLAKLLYGSDAVEDFERQRQRPRPRQRSRGRRR